MRTPCLLAALLALGAPRIAAPAAAPIQIDGDFSEWPGAPFATDPSGDGGVSGVDFTTLWIANDDDRLYLRFDTGEEVQPDEQQNLVLALDTDANPATGTPFGSLGAELIWYLGQRDGTFAAAGQSWTIGHADIGLIPGPTVSATEFEVALRRDAVPAGGQPLFPGPSVRIALRDEGGDELESPGPYSFDGTSVPVAGIPFDRIDPEDLRVATYNIQNDGLFDGGARASALNRIFDAIAPDVWILNEVWNHGAGDIEARVEELLPSNGGESWTAVKLDGGNVVVSRLPVLSSWEVSPGNRLTAVLLDPRPSLDSDLLVVANHWSCCTADAARQEQADALIAFLRDARTPGGVIDLAADTPIVAAGDFNLVGWRRQLETLLTGDIEDNGTFGPDAAPDWDGSDFDPVLARHPDARLTATWWRDSSSFYPGRLDWILHTGSVLMPRKSFVAETRSMTVASLVAAGLDSGDTELGSDHAPVVVDYRAANGTVGAVAPPGRPSILKLSPLFPSPFRSSTEVRLSLAVPGRARVTVHDVAGRLVRVLADAEREAGSWTLRWDGADEAGRPVAAGAYWVRAAENGEAAVRRVVRLR